jgi:signal transduction histidine kinase
LISLGATGLVAVLFQPIRERLQQVVNRLTYGERDDPVAVLTRLGRRLETALAPDAALPTMVETVAQALRLPYVAIKLKARSDDTFTVAATYGTPPTDDELLILALRYQTETIGQLLLAPRSPGDRFSAADRRLLENIAHQAGAAVRAMTLTADLQRSRERLVTAREEERRRLRRDLHDGLGPALASLTLKLDAARNLLARNPTAADRLLVELKGQSQTAIADIRRLVYALRPPTLDELGLVSALREQALTIGDQRHLANGGNLQVLVEAPESLPPQPAAVEVAAYRIIMEALTNVTRHAGAGCCRISLTPLDNELWIEVVDDGLGLPLEPRLGVGLNSMRERAEELGGSCHIEPGPAGGTRVTARLPLDLAA